MRLPRSGRGVDKTYRQDPDYNDQITIDVRVQSSGLSVNERERAENSGNKMRNLLEHFSKLGRPAVWLEDDDYAERLLTAGETPWLDVSGFLSFRRKSAGLLPSDVAALAVGRVAAAWVEAHRELRENMAAKRRAVAPLKTLLASEALRAHLKELLAGLGSSSGGKPIVLVMPSPRCWVADAYRLAFDAADGARIGEDEIDSAAVYVADFLRTFAESPVAGVLLQEAAEDGPESVEEILWYQPVINIAEHYRWDLGLALRHALIDPLPTDALTYVVTPSPIAGVVCGVETGTEFWTGSAPPVLEDGNFRYAVIPADAVPESVLERLAALRD